MINIVSKSNNRQTNCHLCKIKINQIQSKVCFIIHQSLEYSKILSHPPQAQKLTGRRDQLEKNFYNTRFISLKVIKTTRQRSYRQLNLNQRKNKKNQVNNKIKLRQKSMVIEDRIVEEKIP